MNQARPEPLTADQAHRFAVDRGLVAPSAESAALGGGVSNDTQMVTDAERRVVVKRALGQLRTPMIWHASPRRALDEAAALRMAAAVTPDHVPRVLAVDEPTATIAIEAAPHDWVEWKQTLRDGTVDPAVARTLGDVLGRWHAALAAGAPLLGDLDGMDRMEELRIGPFHEVVAARHPDLAGPIGDAVADLRTRRRCLVHGDFSPKNVLAGPGGVWVIDFEVAHVGDPVFDLAFMETHLLLKAIASPHDAVLLRRCADSLRDAYRRAMGAEPARAVADEALHRLGPHSGCLVLARIDGTSGVDYLDEAGRTRARDLGRALLATPPIPLERAWTRLEQPDA